MKVFKSISAIFFAIMLCTNFMSCNKNDENADDTESGIAIPGVNRKLKTIKTTYNNGNVYFDFSNPIWYKGKLQSFIYGEYPDNEKDRMSIEYLSDNEASIYRLGNGEPEIIKLNNAGFATKAFGYYIRYNQNGQITSLENAEYNDYCALTYDSNGDIIKHEASYSDDDDFVKIYYYTNNKVNAPIENKGGIMLLSEWGIMWDYEYYYWFGIYGKSTKHLPVKVGNNTFDWTLDKQGYPTKCVFHRADGMQAIYTFEWE